MGKSIRAGRERDPRSTTRQSIPSTNAKQALARTPAPPRHFLRAASQGDRLAYTGADAPQLSGSPDKTACCLRAILEVVMESSTFSMLGAGRCSLICESS
jgi:hypothetical protein